MAPKQKEQQSTVKGAGGTYRSASQRARSQDRHKPKKDKKRDRQPKQEQQADGAAGNRHSPRAVSSTQQSPRAQPVSQQPPQSPRDTESQTTVSDTEEFPEWGDEVRAAPQSGGTKEAAGHSPAGKRQGLDPAVSETAAKPQSPPQRKVYIADQDEEVKPKTGQASSQQQPNRRKVNVLDEQHAPGEAVEILIPQQLAKAKLQAEPDPWKDEVHFPPPKEDGPASRASPEEVTIPTTRLSPAVPRVKTAADPEPTAFIGPRSQPPVPALGQTVWTKREAAYNEDIKVMFDPTHPQGAAWAKSRFYTSSSIQHERKLWRDGDLHTMTTDEMYRRRAQAERKAAEDLPAWVAKGQLPRGHAGVASQGQLLGLRPHDPTTRANVRRVGPHGRGHW